MKQTSAGQVFDRDCIVRSEAAGFDPPYRGKVRDVYTLNEETIAIVVTDRISAFDHILKQPIPCKGQILNRISAFTFQKVTDLVDTHVIAVPHPNVMIAKRCSSLPVEVVVRGYLAGHAWRTYSAGTRILCGVELPCGLKRNQKFAHPVLTPTTKAIEGHDMDITRDEILGTGIVDKALWEKIEATALSLFKRGTEIAASQGLILVDTKYEFGLQHGNLVLIDEVHTPDSSRYFYSDGYEERLEKNQDQRQLSKEFIREWLIEKNFMGKEGQTMPDLPQEFITTVYKRYVELYERLTGKEFTPVPVRDFNTTLAEILSRYA
ncbi:MAG: phosphoribosylaminoimidazolesuccinocarboxamide synthase [Rhodothermaceae bacterium]|nr:phosphoribosylaminoimidazolesuccinocarboxamide synthase [Rhodothermaceae bacterium]